MKSGRINNLFRHAAADVPAALVVFLVALPLCLGIALASDAPLFSGIIAGFVGGIVVGIMSGSQLSVSGPAAGLTVVVAGALAKLPAFEAFLLAVVIAGVLQVIYGYLKAGLLGDFIPVSVLKGMLAAIGVILILKQIPHLVGYDADYPGDESFLQRDGENTFSEILLAIRSVTPLALILGFCSLLLQFLWETNAVKSNRLLRIFPAPLLVVVMGVVFNELMQTYQPGLAITKKHLVQLPLSDSFHSFLTNFTLPDIRFLSDPQVWISAVTLSLVASIESLLSVEATDKLDPVKRITPANRELKAQGIGNILSGLLGGLPVTAVIVRSSANINAGARTKTSAIVHGVLLLLSVYFIPGLLNKIPLASLAGVLIYTGYKLAKPAVFKEQYKNGINQIIPFVTTLFAIVFTDLLTGIAIGLLVSVIFIIKSNYHTSIILINDEDRYLVRFKREVSFLNKARLKELLDSIPANSKVLIDSTHSTFIDHDIIEVVNDFTDNARAKGISVEIKTDNRYEQSLFKNTDKN